MYQLIQFTRFSKKKIFVVKITVFPFLFLQNVLLTEYGTVRVGESGKIYERYCPFLCIIYSAPGLIKKTNKKKQM